MNFNFSIFKISKIDEFQNDSTIKNEKIVIEYMIFFVEKIFFLTFLCKTFKKMIDNSNNVFFATTKNKITKKKCVEKKNIIRRKKHFEFLIRCYLFNN